MTLFLSLIKTYLIFIFFSLIISLFGSIFIYIFQKQSKKRWNLSILEYGFISYAVGILIYLIIAYILNIFKFFNFYTAFLPFLIISSTFLLFLLKKKKIRHRLTQIKHYLSLNYKSIIKYILILIIIYLMQFLIFWPKISKTSALLARDSYYWTKHSLYLNENGIVNYSELGPIYPWGFIFFSGGNLLISNDFTTTYYFMKLACFPFLNFYILVMFSISKRIFKKNTLIFFCLISILSHLYFIYRIMMFLSSSIAILLILISFIILLTATPNYLLAFIIPATFLLNPVYAFYFIVVLIIFYIIKIIISKQNKILIYKEFMIITSLSIIFFIPYIISVFVFYGKDLIGLLFSFSHFFEISFFDQSITMINVPLNYQSKLFLLNLSNYALYSIQYLVYAGFIFLPCFGFLLNIIEIYKKDNRFKIRRNKYKEDIHREFIIFLKVGFVIIIFVLLAPSFLSAIRFVSIYHVRILEGFIPFLILPSAFAYEWILTKSSKLWDIIKLKYKKLKNRVEKTEFNKRILNLSSFVITSMLISSSFTYIYTNNNLEPSYYYDDSLVDCIFHINNNIEKESNIAVYDFNEPSFHSSAIYYLLYNFNLTFYQPLSNTTLNEFWDFLQSRKIDFLIINLSYFNQTFIDDFYNSSSFKLTVGNNSRAFSLYMIL